LKWTVHKIFPSLSWYMCLREVSPKGREGKEIEWPLQQKWFSAQSVTYEMFESAPRILLSTMCNQHFYIA
jgi:hypothetical protein